jgi:hypothetical protein
MPNLGLALSAFLHEPFMLQWSSNVTENFLFASILEAAHGRVFGFSVGTFDDCQFGDYVSGSFLVGFGAHGVQLNQDMVQPFSYTCQLLIPRSFLKAWCKRQI